MPPEAQNQHRALPHAAFAPGLPGSSPITVDGLGTILAGNPADPQRPPTSSPDTGQPMVAWSGWLGDQPAAGKGLWRSDPATWGPGGLKALHEIIRRLTVNGLTPVLRPHARHLLCDPQRCLSLLNGDGPRFRILLDPVAMLTPDMLKTAEDHLVRAVESLLHRSEVVGVIRCGARLAHDDRLDGPELLPAAHDDAAAEIPCSLLDEVLGRVGTPAGTHIWTLEPAN